MKPRILIAGIGNIFLGDDAFGVEVARRLMNLPWPEGVRVADYGIRGFDLAYELMDDYDAFILIDAVPRGEAPGTLYTIEIDVNDLGETASEEVSFDAHALHPLRVLQMVKAMGGRPKRVLLVGCEPEALSGEEQFEGRMGLSAPVEAAANEAAGMVGSLVTLIRMEQQTAAVP
jgi:hydrogenase maturation protease